ncbi:MAG: TIGR04211 family SH3 domain-containing protein [Gammaproteobacteria bacterium]|nr:TIGR04211 family SH3 domain-containing protein [Gammaproteobacteria bacterium]
MLMNSAANAETLYVTDRILLGVHQMPNEQSPVIISIVSGTPVNVLLRNDNFLRVRTPDGQEGWVSSKFLKKEKPVSAELESVQAQLAEEQAANNKLNSELDRVERELQVHRDEASNAKTTIKELNDALKKSSNAEPIPPNTEEITKAKAEIARLQDKLAKLEVEKNTPAPTTAQPLDLSRQLQQLDGDNQALRVRIEAAVANLKGEKVPTNAELAAIRPKFPFWYWLIMLVVLTLGATAGIYGYDYFSRKRHGGFRL